MTAKERIIKLLERCPDKSNKESIADYLLDNGVSVEIPPSYTSVMSVLGELECQHFKNPIVSRRIQLARVAVSKQIPEKSKSYGWYYECGKCRRVLAERTAHCPHCGQALDWSDTE